jgi:cell division septation protein DedD
MEQNKTLLIILSVALFLAAILSVGLWFFYPREQTAGVSDSVETARVTADDPIEWVRRNNFPALSQPEPADPQEDVIIVRPQYGETPGETPPVQADPARSNPVPYPPASPALTAPAVKPPPAPPAPAPARQPEKPRTSPPAAPAARPAAPKTVTVQEYSIQVGAYSNRDRAEELNQVLKEKGLTGQVFYADGPNLYRLRIGPYTNKAEAEKFLGWVRSIQGFEDSMIFERTATRTAAN